MDSNYSPSAQAEAAAASAAETPQPLTNRVYLSVVIPAYNEQNRLPETLDLALKYLRASPYSYDIIVADDGSSDGTAALVEGVAAQEAERGTAVRVLRLPHRGKAAAVRAGVLAAGGSVILFCDADHSTPIEEVAKLLPFLEEGGYDVAIGSREGQGSRRIGEPFYRHLMGRVFNLLVRFMTGQKYEDTQCGFKAFRREVAHDLFRRLRLYGDNATEVRGAMVTGFDVEVLFLAQKRGYRVREVPVIWDYAPGSKVSPVRDTLRMVRDTVAVRLNDMRGVYTP